MRRPGLPLFLKRQPYRRRRAMDAARLLPALGLFLFLLPMLWAPTGGAPAPAGQSTAADGAYLFLAWAVLILVAGVLAPRLAASDRPVSKAEGAPTETGSGGGD